MARKDTTRPLKREMVTQAKSKPCILCGCQYHHSAMDLHHTDPSVKEANISCGIKTMGVGRLRKEIEKCVVLCAVCHRLVHAGEMTIPEYRERDSNP